MGEPIVVGGRMPTGGNRRALILLGIAGALLVILVVVPGLLGGGDDGGTGTDGAALPSPTTAPVQEEELPETVEIFSSKNPFEPLVDVPIAVEGDDDGGEGAEPDTSGDGESEDGGSVTDDDDFDDLEDFDPIVDEGSVDDGSSDGGSGDGGGTPDGGGADDGGTPGTTATTTTTAPPRYPDRVSLLEVFRDQSGRVVASVRVNDTTYQVGEGEDFARSYRVIDLDPAARCGQFLFGDDRFSMCERDEVLKHR